MAELRRRRPKMNEITKGEDGQDEVSYMVLESSDSSSQKTDSNSELGATTSGPALENEEPALEYVANVGVTVESRDCQGDALSSTGSEAPKEQELEDEINEETSGGDENAEEDKSDDGEDNMDEVDDQTVTCSLLGLEHAKVGYYYSYPFLKFVFPLSKIDSLVVVAPNTFKFSFSDINKLKLTYFFNKKNCDRRPVAQVLR